MKTGDAERNLPFDIWKGIVDAHPCPICLTDLKGYVLYANPAFEQLTGYDAPHSVGRHIKFLKSGCHTEEFYRRLWQQIMEGVDWEGRFINRRKDESLFVVDACIRKLALADGLTTFLFCMKDCS